VKYSIVDVLDVLIDGMYMGAVSLSRISMSGIGLVILVNPGCCRARLHNHFRIGGRKCLDARCFSQPQAF